MKRKHWKVWRNSVLILLICSIYSIDLFATQSERKEVEKTIEELQEKKEQVQQQEEELDISAENLEGELVQFNESLRQTAEALNSTEGQLAVIQQSLAETQEALEAARQQEAEQYQAMKKRIQFLYETGMNGFLEILSKAEGIADFLNRGEYVSSIYTYDRNMLKQYKTTRAEIAKKEAELQEQERVLAALQQQQNETKAQMAALVSDTSQQLGQVHMQLAQVRENVAQFDAKIQEQMAYEEELERQKAIEDARRMEEIRRQEEEIRKQREEEERRRQEEECRRQEEAENQEHNGQEDDGQEGSGQGDDPLEGESQIVPEASDIAILAAIIQCEADGECYEGKLAVGSVVLNRVKSSYFPNTIAGVIYQSGQFSPVASGRFAAVLAKGANSTCIQAANEVLGGNITLDCLYFRTNNGLIDGIVIGNHVFY